MITKKELLERICHLELDTEFLYEELDKIQKQIKKLNKEKKK